MDLAELKKVVSQLIINDDVKSALSLVSDNLNSSGEKFDTIVLLISKFNRMKNKKIQQTLSVEKIELAESQLIESLQSFMRELEPTDLSIKGSGIAHNWITDKIIIISPEEKEAPKEMSDFFRDLKFKNAQVLSISSFEEFENTFPGKPENAPQDSITLIVFDNTDLSFCPNEKMADEKIKSRVQLMKEFVDKTDFFFIHYGEVLYWLNSKEARLRFHPANSKFALYARVKEMLDFIATIHV